MPVINRPISHRMIARSNGFLGINWTKKQKYAAAIEKEALYKQRYLECKQSKTNKGKIPYPDDPKGPCKASWKDWQKWRGKAGERAIALAEQAERKGKLDPLAAAELQADAARSMAEDPIAVMQQAIALPEDQVDVVLGETLSTSSGPPWLLLGGGAVAGTLILVLLLRR